MDNIKPMREDQKGYRPLFGTMNYEIKATPETKDVTYRYDSLKLHYLERLIKDCQAAKTQLVFTVSPQYGNTDDAVLAPVKDLCSRYGLPFHQPLY